MKKPFKNKAVKPPENKAAKKVTVRVKPNRAVQGVGSAGETARIDSEFASSLEKDGMVTILKEK